MGGFAGGDEAGYWEIDTHPQTNSDLPNLTKPTIHFDENGYWIKAYGVKKSSDSTLWTRLEEDFDTLRFIPTENIPLTIICHDLSIDPNPFLKAFDALLRHTNNPDITEFFSSHAMIIEANGKVDTASHIAAFLHMSKEVCNLILSTDELASIAYTIDSDAPFYVYLFQTARRVDHGTFLPISIDSY